MQLNYVKATSDLPIDTLGSNDMNKPLVLYITGDGGFNNFSKAFMKQWNANGYPVVALNAKSYFWKTKAPEDAARDIAALIDEYLSLWKRNEVVLVGYSFGSDVMPFIQTRLAPGVLNKIRHTVLFSPSKNTDFTIHLFYDDGGSSVAAEINRINKPVLVVFGDEEKDLPELQINNKMVTLIKVKGDHHYDNKISEVVNSVAKRL
jgi:type IV secretory pathway VirJ component